MTLVSAIALIGIGVLLGTTSIVSARSMSWGMSVALFAAWSGSLTAGVSLLVPCSDALLLWTVWPVILIVAVTGPRAPLRRPNQPRQTPLS